MAQDHVAPRRRQSLSEKRSIHTNEGRAASKDKAIKKDRKRM